MRKTTLSLCLALAGLAAGCSNAPAPPADTRAADLQAVKDVEAAWAKDTTGKDPDKWAGYFAEDSSALYPGAATLNGKAAIKGWATQFFSDPNFALNLHSDKAVASKGGDIAYTQGTYTVTLTNPKTKKPMTDKGKYLSVFGKQADGTWKVIADTFNSDSAM